MADKLPHHSKDSIIQGLQECFAVNKNVVRAILDSENWNIEKCLRLLEAVSPKVDKSKRTLKGGNNNSVTNKKKESVKIKEGNNNKNNAAIRNKSGVSTSAGNNTSKGRRKNKPNVTVVKDVKVPGTDGDTWAFVGLETKQTFNPSKAKQNASKSKNVSPAPQNFAKATQKVVSEPKPDDKKKKRTVLKSAYEIIKQKNNAEDRIRDCTKFEIRVLILMRGCPGSGKSTYAHKILAMNGIRKTSNHIFSTDNYFVDSEGSYNYDRNNLDKAHAWNQELVEKVMKLGLSPVIVDNTHIKAWEMMSYAQFAVRLGYALETLEPPTPWFFNESVLAKKNSHGVTKDRISLMLQSYEPNLSGKDLLHKFNIGYNISQVPPQMVNYCEESVLTVINKATATKRAVVANSSKNKSSQNFPAYLKANSNLPLTSDIEVIKTVSLKSEFPSNHFSNFTNDKNNSLSSKTTFTFPSCSNDLYNDNSYKTDRIKNKLSGTKVTINSPDIRSSFEKATFKSTDQNIVTENLSSYSDFYSGKGINLIDKPIDEYLGTSLASPLTPEPSSSKQETINRVNIPDTMSFDPSDFPTLSSSCTMRKSSSHSDFTKNRLCEEKIKKVTELFPHLDKEYISDLCSDTNKNLDDIVNSLLDPSFKAPLKNLTPEATLNNSESEEDESGSDEEDITNVLESDLEKEIAMLIQLFPNIKESRIRDLYEKFSFDFKIALEWLLHDDSTETSSEVNDGEDIDSASLPEPLEMRDDFDSAQNVQFDQLVQSLKEYNKTDEELKNDFSNSYPVEPSTFCVDNYNTVSTSVSVDKHMCNESDEGNLKIDEGSGPNQSSYNVNEFCEADVSLKYVFDNKKRENGDYSKETDNTFTEVNEFEEKKGNARFICNFDGASSKVFDVTKFHKNIPPPSTGENNCNPDREHTSKSEELLNPEGNTELEIGITLDSFEVAMKNVLSSLSKNSDVPDSYETMEHSNGNQVDVDNTKSNPNTHSELMSNLLNWNFGDKADSEPVDKGIDFSAPKEQRDKFNASVNQTSHSATNTNYKDFETLKKAQNPGVFSDKILSGTMNFISCNEPQNKICGPKNKLMLDKGICTEDVETGFTLNHGHTGALLASMFPTISPNDLDSLLKSCVGDLNWAVGLLLDSGHEVSPDFNPSEHNFQIQGVTDPSDANETQEEVVQEQISPAAESPQNLKSKKRSSQRVPIENINFIMNDDSISSHVKKIRNARLGIVDPVENAEAYDEGPSTSGTIYDVNAWSNSSEDDDEEEDTLDVALNTDFILALQEQFGGYIPKVVPGNNVLVSLPVYLARQLHSCITDSLSKQLEEEQHLIDQMIEEDECLARHLQEMENDPNTSDNNIKQPSIQEIMDEELAFNIHKSLNVGKSNEETMAGKLARQLLIERFPTMDPLALKSILEDTDHSLYQATHLLETAGYQRAKPTSQAENIWEMASANEEMTREESVKQAGAYREAAKEFFQMRHDCFQKAHKAYLEGNKHVASYYSQMANWHNQRIEQANLLASTILLNGNKNSTTLDLHFLRVCEAIQMLDLFIDAHVNNLVDINQRRRQLYIITGRGLHSHNGRSKIRPATITRLKQRCIWYQYVNPGLLMIQLTSKTPLTYQK